MGGDMTERNKPVQAHVGYDVIIRMAIANLRFKGFRSAITLTGVVIGIGSIYFLISFGIGVQQLVQGQVIGNQSINTVDISPSNSAIISLSQDNMDQIGAVSNVNDLTGVYMLASQVTLDGSSVDLVAYGVQNTYMKLSNLTIEAGAALSESGEDEIIINTSLLEALGVREFKTVIGKDIKVKLVIQDKTVEKDMNVIGVVNSGAGSEIFVSQNVFRDAGVENYTQAKAVVDDRERVSDVRRSIESMGYETTSPIDTLDQINEVFRVFNIVLIGLGSTGMVIAILGMINTLTVSLLERTREIALMITIRARPKDMKRLFTVEAMILSGFGGVIGILVATLGGLSVDLFLNRMASGRGVTESFTIFAISPLLILGTLVFIIGMGAAVSYLPARRAAKIDPMKALRQE